MPPFNTIDEILADMRLGKMAVIMDDEDRENEGDLVMPAACVRAEDVNFMARYGRGLICLTLTKERFQHELHKHPAIAVSLVFEVSRRLRDTLDMLDANA